MMKDEERTKEQLLNELAPLREKVAQLEKAEAGRRKAEERINHLNSVLRAIRRVNQFISKEMDRDHLLKGICERLIATRGYHNAWIALLDENGELITTAEAGLGDEFLPMAELLKREGLGGCGQRYGPGSFHCLWDHQTEWRLYLGLQRTGCGHDLQDLPP
jgi:hypothetical protein